MKTEGTNHEKLRKGVIGATADSHQTAGNIGLVGGGLAGAAIGSALGPMGALTGAVLGATFGPIAAKGIAEGIDPEVDREYWEERFRSEPYHDSRFDFPDYDPAYQMGTRYYRPHVSFEAAEKEMSAQWAQGKGSSRLDWEQARPAAKASWDRAHSAS